MQSVYFLSWSDCGENWPNQPATGREYIAKAANEFEAWIDRNVFTVYFFCQPS